MAECVMCIAGLSEDSVSLLPQTMRVNQQTKYLVKLTLSKTLKPC